jgi:hypothetical protein
MTQRTQISARSALIRVLCVLCGQLCQRFKLNAFAVDDVGANQTGR